MSPAYVAENLSAEPQEPPSSATTTRLRLAFVIDVIQDWHAGGTEQQIVQILNRVDPRHFEPVVFVLQPSEGLQKKAVNCPVILIGPAENGKRSRPRMLLDLTRAIRAFRPHILQTFFIDGTFYGTVAAKLARVPVVIQSRRNAGYWQKPYHTLALRALNHVVDAWQCNSRHVADALMRREHISANKIALLPNSIDLAHFSSPDSQQRMHSRQKLDLSPSAPVFAAVANLRPVKRLATLIEAAAIVHATLPEARFLILGEGNDRSALATQIEALHLEGVVRLEGAQPDVRPWLRAADVGVLTSESESSSNAVLEYMAMGLPTVVSDIPANRELVEGLFFAAGDAQQLADRLLWIWHHPEVRQAMAGRNLKAAAAFDATAAAQQAQRYYWELACGNIPGFRGIIPYPAFTRQLGSSSTAS